MNINGSSRFSIIKKLPDIAPSDLKVYRQFVYYILYIIAIFLYFVPFFNLPESQKKQFKFSSLNIFPNYLKSRKS